MPINYIIQLQLFFDSIRKDPSIKYPHQILYVHFFFQWNRQLFNPVIKFDRDTILGLTSMSKETFYKSLKHLSKSGYLIYPYNNKDATVKMLESFDVGAGPDLRTSDNPESGTGESPDKGQKGASKKKKVLDSGQPIVNNKTVVINVNQTNTNPAPSPEDVLVFFKLQKYTLEEARNFQEHFDKKNWKSNGDPIRNWKGMAVTFVTTLRNTKNDNNNNESEDDFNEP